MDDDCCLLSLCHQLPQPLLYSCYMRLASLKIQADCHEDSLALSQQAMHVASGPEK